MTEFSDLLLQTGLSDSEAAEYLTLSDPATVRKFKSGRMIVPGGIKLAIEGLLADIDLYAAGNVWIALPFESTYRKAQEIKARIERKSLTQDKT